MAATNFVRRMRGTALGWLAGPVACWLERPGFRPLHELSRQVLSESVRTSVQAAVRAAAAGRGEIAIMIRHSALAPGEFHLLRSDVDFSVVFASPPEPARAERARRACEGMRAIFPWIGEPEIYAREEWERREWLGREFRPLLELHWRLRKWRWQRRALAEALTPYHRMKSRASIDRIRARLSLGPGETAVDSAAWRDCVASRLRGVGIGPDRTRVDEPSPAAPGFLGFLEWNLRSGVTPEVDENAAWLQLPYELALPFAATLPDGEAYFPGWESRIDACRRRPDIARVLAAVCENEWLMCRSVIRTRSAEESRVRGWVERLRKLVARYSTNPV